MNVIWVNEPNVIDSSSFAFENLHSAKNILMSKIIHAMNELSKT